MTLSGPNCQDLIEAKKCIKLLLRIAYHLYIEKEMVVVDQRFKQTLMKQVSGSEY
jgi:hypothetical protein